jgi:hypothetical protein
MKNGEPYVARLSIVFCYSHSMVPVVIRTYSFSHHAFLQGFLMRRISQRAYAWHHFIGSNACSLLKLFPLHCSANPRRPYAI